MRMVPSPTLRAKESEPNVELPSPTLHQHPPLGVSRAE